MTVLEKLLHPTPAANFVRDIQGRHFLHHRGAGATLASLLGEEYTHRDFFTELAAPGYDGRAVTATFFEGRVLRGGEGKPRSFEVKPGQAETAFRAGLSVIGDMVSPAALRLAAHLRRDLNHTGELMIAGSLSPGGDAFHAHIDPVDSFKIQVEGRKRWFVSPAPILDFPTRAAALRDNGTLFFPASEPDDWERLQGLDASNSVEIVLEPGDILYVPPGMVHATEADGMSFSVDIGFLPASPFSFLRKILDPVLEAEPTWRHMPASIARDGRLPREVREHLAARISELRAALDAIDLDGPEVNRIWQRAVANPGDKVRAALAANRPQAGGIQPESELAVTEYAPVAHAWTPDESGEPAIDVYQAESHLSVPGAGAGFLRRVLEEGRFRASDASSFAPVEPPLPWEDVAPYLAMLGEQGLIAEARR